MRWATLAAGAAGGEGDQRAALQEGLMRQRLEKYPDDFNANYNLGDALLNQGNAGGRHSVFRGGAQGESRERGGGHGVGRGAVRRGQAARGRGAVQAGAGARSGATPTRATISASVQAARGKWDERPASSSACSGARPDDTKARQHWARRCTSGATSSPRRTTPSRRWQRYREAPRFGRPAPSCTPRWRSCWRGWGVPEAQAELEAALKIDPSFAPAQRMLADVRKRLEGK